MFLGGVYAGIRVLVNSLNVFTAALRCRILGSSIQSSRVSQDAQVVGRGAFPDLAVIFVEGNVEQRVVTVFEQSVGADVRNQRGPRHVRAQACIPPANSVRPRTMKQVGVLGLGIIGSRIAQCYRDGGYAVSVWSRTPRAVSGFLPTPRAVADSAKVVQIFVNAGDSLLFVLRDLAPTLTAQHVVVNSATVSLEATTQAAQLVQKSGAAFLDCPFTGSRDAASAGQLVYYVGGADAVLEQVRPVLALSAKEIIPVGKIGDATVLKIATNMISATTVQVLSEAMAVTAAAGVDLEKFQRAMESNACCSGLARMKMPSMMRGDFAPHFSLKNMLKDSRFALDLAAQHGLTLPTLSAASSCMAELAEDGGGDEDYSVLATQYLHRHD